MTIYNPGEIFAGEVLIIVPHMDDEVLACGGTIAHLPGKERIHLLYVTDGTKSPVPMFSWMGEPSPKLGDIRIDEARAAMAVLGVPNGNIRFLALPDGNLKRYQDELGMLIREEIKNIRPAYIFIPFRYDRHQDHLATSRAAYWAFHAENSRAEVLEYFVYNRYQLLPKRDIRKYLRSEQLIEIEIKTQGPKKKEALQCFESQTEIIYGWQERPILTKDRVEEVSYAPEVFLKYDHRYPGPSVFEKSGAWIRFVHQFEPFLKDKKEKVLALLHWPNTRHGR